MAWGSLYESKIVTLTTEVCEISCLYNYYKEIWDSSHKYAILGTCEITFSLPNVSQHLADSYLLVGHLCQVFL